IEATIPEELESVGFCKTEDVVRGGVKLWFKVRKDGSLAAGADSESYTPADAELNRRRGLIGEAVQGRSSSSENFAAVADLTRTIIAGETETGSNAAVILFGGILEAVQSGNRRLLVVDAPTLSLYAEQDHGLMVQFAHDSGDGEPTELMYGLGGFDTTAEGEVRPIISDPGSGQIGYLPEGKLSNLHLFADPTAVQ
ncbi:MAG: hypothetical protein AAB971_00095, partial [Patescibacteria group bacterium]